jgi:diacylglycerol kinase (ATP)
MKPSDGYIAYIVNPKSGSRGHKLTGRRFKKYLINRGFEVRIYLTASLEHACELANDAAVDYNCAVVVVVGGDGTVREVAHGLEGSDKPLLIVPCGTENLLANELGFDEKFKTLVKTFEQAYTRSLDLGSFNGKCFTSVVGVGFDGEIVKKVAQQRTGHIDHFDYFWPIWRTFWSYKFQPNKVMVDDEQIFEGQGLVFVGNISRYALGLKILHDADCSDGLLDICIYKCASQLHLLKHSLFTIVKQHTKCKDVIYRQGKTVTITADSTDVETELDGDPGPGLPAKIEIIPQAINCIVPKNAKPAGMRTRVLRILR